MLKDSLPILPIRERAIVKAREHSRRPLPPPFSVGGVDIEIFSLKHNGPDLVVGVRATKDGQPSSLSGDYTYRNPPILVRDGTFRDEVNHRGETISVPNFKEDLTQALIEMVGETVRLLNG